jgi:hypothetical protein
MSPRPVNLAPADVARVPPAPYADALCELVDSGIPFLVGGAFALGRYTGIARETKDLDVFVRPDDAPRVLEYFHRQGRDTNLTFPHWLGKVYFGHEFMDVIFSSGNGVARVDDQWFEYASVDDVIGVTVRLCPPEEMIWSKAYVQERERFDGADIMHLMACCGSSFDWRRLLQRFGPHWRVLLGHLVTFGFVYPDRRDVVPGWLLADLSDRLKTEGAERHARVCNGTLLSREQYQTDLRLHGYKDARLEPPAYMTPEALEIWNRDIRPPDEEK